MRANLTADRLVTKNVLHGNTCASVLSIVYYRVLIRDRCTFISGIAIYNHADRLSFPILKDKTSTKTDFKLVHRRQTRSSEGKKPQS